jgi:cell wall-associated NlpC family hydrolase/outer membrane murein-binding lipoprotein Lpp
MHRRLLVPALLLILAAIVCGALTPGRASGATIAQKKAQARQIAQQVSALNTKMEVAVEAYDAATQRLTDVQGRIHENEHELIVARYNLLVARQLLSQRVVSMYKQDKADVLDVLLSTHTFDDLVTEVDAMRQVGQSDSETVSTIATLKKQIGQHRVALLAEGKQATALVAQRASTRSQISSDLQTRQTMLRGVQKQIAQMQAAAAAAAKLAAERAAAAAAAAQAAQAAAQAAPQQIQSGGGGGSAGGGTTSAAGAHGSVVAIAQSFLGVPYVWGGASPAGFDCSGLAMYCYAQVGISLPHSAAMQYASITHVAHGSEQPGDLVFFGSSAGGIHHVGIYVGGGSMIDAPYTGVDVRYDSAFSGDYFASGRP